MMSLTHSLSKGSDLKSAVSKGDPAEEIRNCCLFIQCLVRNIDIIARVDDPFARHLMSEMPKHFCYIFNLIFLSTEHHLLCDLTVGPFYKYHRLPFGAKRLYFV